MFAYDASDFFHFATAFSEDDGRTSFNNHVVYAVLGFFLTLDLDKVKFFEQ